MSDVKQTAITAFINAFSEALSNPDSKSISNFYTADGIFFPNNYGAMNRLQLESRKGDFLKNKKFKIAFEIKEMVIKDNFAFVQAAGKAMTTELPDGLSFTTESRDFFVLTKQDESWKIFRYMFNDSKSEQTARWKVA